MLEIRARDYYSLKYDAAAQNKISSLSGKTYIRDVARQKQTKVVDTVKLIHDGADVSAGDEVSLPYAAIAASHWNESGTLEGKTILSPWDMHYRLGALFFGQRLSFPPSESGQSVLMGAFELLFTGLNLPEGVFPTVECSYELQHFSFGAVQPRGASWRTSLSEIYNLKGVQSGTYLTRDWERMWVGAGLAETDARDQVVRSTVTSIPTLYEATDAILHDEYAIKVPNDNRVVDSAVGPDNLRASLGKYYDNRQYISRVNEGFNESIFENVVKPFYTYGREEYPDVDGDISAYLQGGYLDLYKQEIKLLNRDMCRVIVQLPILNAYSTDGNYAIVPTLPDPTNAPSYIAEWPTRMAVTEWLKSVTVTLNYDQMSWTENPFNFSSAKGEGTYPFNFTATRAASAEDRIGETLWENYYPNLIFDKYSEGKHYVELKVRVGFMLKNKVTIDTPVQVYDLNNQVISRQGKPCTFRVKRIIKSFGRDGYYYTINCLED